MICYWNSFIYYTITLSYRYSQKKYINTAINCWSKRMTWRIFLPFIRVCEILHKNAIINCNKIKFHTQFIFLIFFFPVWVCICMLFFLRTAATLSVWVVLPPFDTCIHATSIHNRWYSRVFLHSLIDFLSSSSPSFFLLMCQLHIRLCFEHRLSNFLMMIS